MSIAGAYLSPTPGVKGSGFKSVLNATSLFRIRPVNGTHRADQFAGAALEAPLIIKNQVIPFLIPLVVFRGTTEIIDQEKDSSEKE